MKRSAFGRLSGRQRPDADEVEGGERREETRQRGSGFGRSHDRPPAGDSLREFVLHSLRLRPWRQRGRGLPTRHSPAGNVVSRWTLVAMALSTGTF